MLIGLVNYVIEDHVLIRKTHMFYIYVLQSIGVEGMTIIHYQFVLSVSA